MIDLNYMKDFYFCNGLDVPFSVKKGRELTIKPITVKDYPIYELSKSILEINKNETNDIEIIQMSYLKFLLEIVIKQNDAYRNQLNFILEYCLGIKYANFEKDNGRNCIVVYDKIFNEKLNKEEYIVASVINHKEFDDIIKIILNQNDANYDNRYVNPEVRELMEQYYKAKYQNATIPSLEKRKAFVASKMGKTFKEINEMTYREFDLIYNASVDSEIYIGQKIIQGSFKYEVKEDIVHPLYEKKKDPYSEIFEDTSVLSKKGISGAEQLNVMNLKNNN